MPLVKGAKARTKQGVSQNVRQELETKPRDQAIAIAMRLAGKPRPKGGKK